MKRKHLVLSTIAGMLCLVGMVAGFIPNGLSHTHAAEGLQTNTTQSNTTKSAQSSGRPEDVIQGNIFYGFRGTSVYALNAFTGVLIWKYPHASSLVTVTNGIAYVTSSSGTLVALKALTGSLLWSYQISSDFLWSPLIVNNSVYLGANDGLYALEASHGSLLWHYQTSQGFGLPTSPAPLFAHGTIYYVTYGGTYPAWYSIVSALKATDGSLLWSYKIDGNYSDVGASKISFVKGKVLIRGDAYAWYQQIFFLDPANGSVIYSHRIYVEFHDFFLIDGVIYFTDLRYVYAIRLSDGSVLWSYQPGGSERQSDRIEVVDQIVYVFEGIYETGPVTAHKATDGTLLWSMQPAADASVAGSNNIVYIFQGGTISARKATDGTLLWSYQGYGVGDIVNRIIYMNGFLYALDARNGTLLWSSGIRGWIVRISNGFLYATDPYTGILNVLNASNGTQVWSSGKAASISTVANHIVYVKSSSGTVYALDTTNGTQLWSY